ncbi:hypothetical protein GCM10007880_65430 [Mesorhizobium amorphae]|uniref:DUF982 domain-containing protein n=1 Tax=Mesorhizobium amorphae TaxID=71433 RepID=UPI00235DA40C|nr:DUF982 domain-containing protein [Mesorhizobium amorphae]GLR46025.1 hypothetical protein GCM10007880_65430 [Mesorhizobium amorphae]
MKDRTFDHPIFVKNEQFLVQEIGCLDDAFEFLQAWPKNGGGPIYDTVLRTCQRAYDGQVPLSIARKAFVGFARSVKVLQDVSMSHVE